MNVQCAICQDVLESSNDIFSTPCGHVFHFLCLTQWLDNSPTCPQCRQKCARNKTTRLYFTSGNAEAVKEDSFSLQQKLDNMSFKVKLKESELSKLKEEKAKMIKQNTGLRDQIFAVEKELNNNKSVMHALKEQMIYFKDKAEKVDTTKAEVEKLKKRIENYHNVQTLLAGTNEDVEDMLTTVRDHNSLATYISVMKREFTVSTNKRKELRDTAKKLQTELHNERVKHDRVVKQLREKIVELEERYVLCQSENEDLRRRLSIDDGEESEARIERKRGSTSDLLDAFESGVSENLENPPSKYLQTKSKSILGVKQKPTQRGQFVIGKTAIAAAKKPETRIPAPRSSDDFLSYDGFGGHSRPDIFPEPSKYKLKRPAGDVGKSKKQKTDHKLMDDFVINLT